MWCYLKSTVPAMLKEVNEAYVDGDPVTRQFILRAMCLPTFGPDGPTQNQYLFWRQLEFVCQFWIEPEDVETVRVIVQQDVVINWGKIAHYRHHGRHSRYHWVARDSTSEGCLSSTWQLAPAARSGSCIAQQRRERLNMHMHVQALQQIHLPVIRGTAVVGLCARPQGPVNLFTHRTCPSFLHSLSERQCRKMHSAKTVRVSRSFVRRRRNF